MELDTDKQEASTKKKKAALGTEWSLKLHPERLSQQNYKTPMLTPGQASPLRALYPPPYQNEPLLTEVTPKATHPPYKEAHCNQKLPEAG